MISLAPRPGLEPGTYRLTGWGSICPLTRMNARFLGSAFPILLGRFAQRTHRLCLNRPLDIGSVHADFSNLAGGLPPASGIRTGPSQTMGADSTVLIDEFLCKFVEYVRRQSTREPSRSPRAALKRRGYARPRRVWRCCRKGRHSRKRSAAALGDRGALDPHQVEVRSLAETGHPQRRVGRQDATRGGHSPSEKADTRRSSR